MPSLTFSTWFNIGCYGGLLCSLVMATGTAGYALLWHRGTPRHLAIAMLICLMGAVFILPAAVWDQLRLQLLGPLLSKAEVAFWLSWVAITGWILPLTCTAAYMLLAEPQTVVGRFEIEGLASLRAREHEPLGIGVPWAWLTALDGPFKGRRLTITKETTLIGRHIQNDIWIDTDLASRYHAQLHWDHGHGYLVDCRSLNGTTVNGQRVWIPTLLQNGDVISIGGRSFQFTYADTLLETRSHSVDETMALVAAPSGTPAEHLSAELVGVAGTLAGQRFPLRSSVITLGRDAENTIVLPYSSISRQHAQIVRQEQGDYLQDLGSRNGTFVNGTRLTAPYGLQPGDEVRLGDVVLQYLCERIVLPPPQSDRQRAARVTTLETSVEITDQDTSILHPYNRASRLGRHIGQW